MTVERSLPIFFHICSMRIQLVLSARWHPAYDAICREEPLIYTNKFRSRYRYRITSFLSILFHVRHDITDWIVKCSRCVHIIEDVWMTLFSDVLEFILCSNMSDFRRKIDFFYSRFRCCIYQKSKTLDFLACTHSHTDTIQCQTYTLRKRISVWSFTQAHISVYAQDFLSFEYFSCLIGCTSIIFVDCLFYWIVHSNWPTFLSCFLRNHYAALLCMN